VIIVGFQICCYVRYYISWDDFSLSYGILMIIKMAAVVIVIEFLKIFSLSQYCAKCLC